MTDSVKIQSKQRLRKDGSAPVYRQLAERLMGGDFTEGERLPSEHDLADRFDVSRVTVRKALGHLQARGLIYSEHGRGSYVRPNNINGMSGFGSFTKEVLELGATPASKMLKQDRIDYLPDYIASLVPAAIAPEGPFHRVLRLRFFDQTPCLLERTYLPESVAPGFEQFELANDTSLYGVMERFWGVRPCWADATFFAKAADPLEAECFELEAGHPVMSVLRVTSAENGEVLEIVDATYVNMPIPLAIKRHRFR